jgi:hypothetical protein
MDYSIPCKLKNVKVNDFIMRKPNSNTVFIKEKNSYDRSTKRFCVSDTMNINRSLYLKGSTIVYIGFTY